MQNVGLFRDFGENRRLWDYDATAAQRAGMLGDLADLHHAGVPMVAGTQLACDVGNTPGLSLHDELVWLSEAGFTPAHALRAATLEPARFLGAVDSLGSVAPGKVADLVLLDRDPLIDIRNTRAIRAVVVRGRLLARPALDSLLQGAERAAAATR
jgi:imidazolonepropionase-like amidohydrolase